VRDEKGVKWKIKLGPEARPETVASRLVWGVGYVADEDYFLAQAKVLGLPRHVHRGQHDIGAGGMLRDIRIKREPDDRIKIGTWRWASNPFSGTRELHGLCVLMAVMNNWDLKDVNNAIRQYENIDGTATWVYEVSDLGATFGSTRLEVTKQASEGNLHTYERSHFIKKVTANSVDFVVPSTPAPLILANPHEFVSRLALRWIGRGIPREDARWLGHLLAQLSTTQIRDAFRAAEYSDQDIDRFTAVLTARIDQLNQL
jgi:hypothetical protein